MLKSQVLLLPNLNLNINLKQILNETLKDGIKLSLLLALTGIAYIGIQKLGIQRKLS